MRQLSLPCFHPTYPAPERAVLTLLSAALRVATKGLRDEHCQIESAPALDECHAPIVICTVRLIVDRCAELVALIEFYDEAIDQVLPRDDEIPF